MARGILEQSEQVNSTAPFLVAIAELEFAFGFGFEHNSWSVLNATASSWSSGSDWRCFKRSKQSMTGLVSPGTEVTMPAKRRRWGIERGRRMWEGEKRERGTWEIDALKSEGLDGVLEGLRGVHAEVVDVLFHKFFESFLRDRTRRHCFFFHSHSLPVFPFVSRFLSFSLWLVKVYAYYGELILKMEMKRR